jgi:hypothetical protein
MITAFICLSNKFSHLIFLAALVSLRKQPELASYVFLGSVTILLLLIGTGWWYTERNHWGQKKAFFVLLPLLPLYFIVVFGFIFSMWGGAIVFSLGTIVYGSFYYLGILKAREKIRQNIIKKIEENKPKGFTAKSMQENGLLQKNKTLLMLGFTEEELKEFGLTGE